MAKISATNLLIFEQNAQNAWKAFFFTFDVTTAHIAKGLQQMLQLAPWCVRSSSASSFSFLPSCVGLVLPVVYRPGLITGLPCLCKMTPVVIGTPPPVFSACYSSSSRFTSCRLPLVDHLRRDKKSRFLSPQMSRGRYAPEGITFWFSFVTVIRLRFKLKNTLLCMIARILR